MDPLAAPSRTTATTTTTPSSSTRREKNWIGRQEVFQLSLDEGATDEEEDKNVHRHLFRDHNNYDEGQQRHNSSSSRDNGGPTALVAPTETARLLGKPSAGQQLQSQQQQQQQPQQQPRTRGSTGTATSHPHLSMTAWLGAVANLCSATLGAGILALPYAMYQSGIVCGIVLLVVSGLATIVSISLLVMACTYYQQHTYEALVEFLFGTATRRVVELAILVFCQGCAVAYCVALGDILEQSHLLINHTRSYSILLLWLVAMLPLSLLRSMQSLQFSSSVGFASVITLVFAAWVHWFNDKVDPSHSHTNTTNTTTTWSQWTNTSTTTTDVDANKSLLWPAHGILSLLTACPIFIYAFNCQVNVCAIYKELPVAEQQQQQQLPGQDAEPLDNGIEMLNPSEGINGAASFPCYTDLKVSTMHSVTTMAVCCCGLMYLGLATISLADYGPLVTPNILSLYEPVGVMQLASGCMALAVVVAFPLNIFPSRVTLMDMFRAHTTHRTAVVVDDDEDDVGLTNNNSNHAIYGSNEETKAAAADAAFVGERLVNCNMDRLGGDPTLTAALLEDQQGVEASSAMQKEEGSGLKLSDFVVRDSDSCSPRITPLRDDLLQNSDGAESIPAIFPRDGPNRTSTPRPGTHAGTLHKHVGLTVGLAGSAVALALVVPNISVLFGLLGGTASCLLGFCVPGALGVRLCRDCPHHTNRTMMIASWLLLVGGSLVGVLTTAVTIYTML